MPPRIVPVPTEVRAAVCALVDKSSVRATATKLDLDWTTVNRIANGVSCTRGTVAIVPVRLRELGLLPQ